MSAYRESAISFACEGEPLVGVLSEPTGQAQAEIGVLIIVGGPQYRAGSHRQFTLLARHLAAHGFASFRFDYRGMGDSAGAARDFLGVDDDITAAIATFRSTCAGVRRVVLWGLCDAASAALLHVGSRNTAQVQALCLVNPWARSTASLAKATVKHYYRRRILQKEFWLKIASGRLGLAAIRTLLGNLRDAFSGGGKPVSSTDSRPFQARMFDALRNTTAPCMLILSDLDQTAQEFVEYARTENIWNQLLAKPSISVVSIEGADHTLSKLHHQQQMFNSVAAWLNCLAPREAPTRS